MKRKLLAVCLSLVFPALACADSQWALVESTLTYHVSHPLKQTEGISHEAKGKGVCHAGQCDFLIAVPVKSFDSGDSNRDLHMLQVVRGGQFPMITVRTHLPEDASSQSAIQMDLEIEFAGQTVHYKQISFQRAMQGGDSLVTGTIPLALSDFKIDPPTLLTLPIKNEMSLNVKMRWHEM